MTLLGTGHAHALGEPRFPAPPGCTVGRMGDSMIFNGVPMRVRQLRCPDRVEQVLDFYRKRWPAGTEREPGYVETGELAPWRILTRVERGYLMTVQVTGEPDGYTVGYLAMSEMPDPDDLPELGKGFPAPRESIVHNDIETADPGKQGRTVQLTNRLSKESNVIFYRNWYRDRGWTVVMDRQMGGKMHTFAFKNGNESVNLVIVEGDGGTVVTAQLVEEGRW